MNHMKHHETMITRKIWRASWMGDLPNRRVHVADMLLTNAREPFFFFCTFLRLKRFPPFPTSTGLSMAQHGSAQQTLSVFAKWFRMVSSIAHFGPIPSRMDADWSG